VKAGGETVKIYTKTGDKGETSLRWGERIAKDAVRVEAYGTVDETNAAVGLALSLLPAPGSHALCDQVRAGLTRVQRELFDVGADLATPPDRSKGEQPKVTAALVEAMERDIDALDAHLPPLRHFILPGGSPAASALHVARTVSRRAERLLVTLGKQDQIDPVLLQYLNRLSDYLFICARAVNQDLGVPDPIVEWKK
jgi:cob(I)alamin adenosyltransferase